MLRHCRSLPAPIRVHSRPFAVRSSFRAFSLVEVLVASAILAVLLVFVASILETTQKSMRRSRDRISHFRDARLAFELMTRNLSQATLQTYWDYRYASTGSNLPPENTPVPEQPSAYARQSELHFIVDRAASLLGNDHFQGHACFFQAPLGDSSRYRNLNSLLNGRGYYVAFGDDNASRPAFIDTAGIAAKYRFRLMEFRPPSEQDPNASSPGNSVYVNPEWYKDQLERWSRPVAENIVALFISPRTSLGDNPADPVAPEAIAPRYHYDSRALRNRGVPDASAATQHLLPPLVRVTLVAIDSESANRLAALNENVMPPELAIPDKLFAEAAFFEKDLAAYERQLSSHNLNYRVLSATIPIRAAKWSEALAPPPSP